MVSGLVDDLLAVLLTDNWDYLSVHSDCREHYKLLLCIFFYCPLFISYVVWKSDITPVDNDNPFTRGS